MIDHILKVDQELFFLINQGMSNIIFDWLMPVLRNPYTWAPLYLFLVIFIIRNYKKRGIIMIIFFVLSFALADSISASLIKPKVMRIRPCNEISLKEKINTRVRCGSGYSFPSSHASNHFALGMFLLMVFRKRWKPIVWLSMGWAGIISFAQIYVGVHYPVDIICGTILGCLIGFLTASVFLYFQPDTRIIPS